jgi:type II secretory pathway pseudopilin PulG
MFLNKNGFTFAEIMISIGILSLLLLTVLAIFGTTLSGIKRGENEVVAVSLAQQVMETYKNDLELNFDNYTAGTHANVVLDQNIINGIPFTAEIDISQVGGFSTSRIKKVEVHIGWKENNMGNSKFKLTTYINKVNDK